MNVKLKNVFLLPFFRIENFSYLFLRLNVSIKFLLYLRTFVNFFLSSRVQIEVQSRTLVRDFFCYLFGCSQIFVRSRHRTFSVSLTQEYDVTYPSPPHAQYFHYFTFIRSYYFTFKDIYIYIYIIVFAVLNVITNNN